MKPNHRKLFYRSIALTISLSVGISSGSTFAKSFEVKGHSMIPTLEDGDIVTVDEDNQEYNNGDMVIAKLKNGKFVVKRLSGDKLVGDNKSGSINVPISDVDTIVGKATENQQVLTAKEKQSFEKVFALGIKQVIGNNTHSAALTESGEVYTWEKINITL